MKAKVTGIKASKGTMENGQSYDSTKVYIETRLDESKGNQKGFATVEYNFGSSDEFHKLKHLPVPFIAEVEFEQITNGKTVKTIIGSLAPLTVEKKAA
ncbi:hypothetical protein ACFQUU_27030 [Herbaspirillum sp. GCM10030257]|uniref:hypothetical protein n=1 Tax=Herbaspirillum sp. GCM10030257 TaxID=3273393 RepID=UPI003610AE6F